MLWLHWLHPLPPTSGSARQSRLSPKSADSTRMDMVSEPCLGASSSSKVSGYVQAFSATMMR